MKNASRSFLIAFALTVAIAAMFRNYDAIRAYVLIQYWQLTK